jgi:hypothetical protein
MAAVWVANEALDGLRRRKPVLTAKWLLTNQAFRGTHGTDTLAIDQRRGLRPHRLRKGAIVKTICEAVMATIETPDRAIRMREAMSNLGAERQHQNLVAGIYTRGHVPL